MTSYSWHHNLQSRRIRKLGTGSTIHVDSLTLSILDPSWRRVPLLWDVGCISRRKTDYSGIIVLCNIRTTYWLSNGHVTDDVTWPPKVMWGSTGGYPSDSLASVTSMPSLVPVSGFRLIATTAHSRLASMTCSMALQPILPQNFSRSKLSFAFI